MLTSDQEMFAPDWFSKPADSILGLMKRREVPINAVADSLDGGMDTVRGLMTGTQPIDDRIAHSLSKSVGGSPAFWLKRQKNYESALEFALDESLGEMDDWLLTVLAPGSRPRGRLSEARKKDELRRRLAFYGVNSLKAWFSRYGQIRDGTNFRTSRALSSNEGSISLWLRQGELEAALTTTERWDPSKLRRLLPDILKLSKIRQPERFLPRLKALGAEAGVAIVIARSPKGCRASGASRMVAPEKAMVLMSFRHLSDDHFWFTLFHEFGHLLLHKADAFVDVDDMYLDEREQEANEFASTCIVPPDRWEDFANLHYDRESIIRFSVSLGVAPGLIVGQLQHRQAVPRDRLNFLKRRWTWAEIETAIAS